MMNPVYAALMLVSLLMAACTAPMMQIEEADLPAEAGTDTEIPDGVPARAIQNSDVVRVVNPPLSLQAFSLPASTGETLSLADFQGKWLLVFFGYVHCPDFCPTTLVDFQRTKAELGTEAEAVRFIYISVDGLRDTPEVLREYLAYFDPDFIGLTGDDATLTRIQPDFGMYYRRQATDGASATYSVDHSTRSYLIDAQGRLRVSFAYRTDPALVAAVIRDYIGLQGGPIPP